MLLNVSQIFETPWPVLTGAIIVLAVIVLVRQALPEKRRWWQLLIPLVIGAAAFGLDYFYETDYEKIESVLNSGMQAVIDRDPTVFDKIISEDYRDPHHRSKEAFVRFCRNLLNQPLIERKKELQKQVTISAPTAQVGLSIRLHLSSQNTYAAGGTLVFVKLKFNLAKTANGNWLISRAELVEVNNLPMNWGGV
ncbi:MAG: hypothetical protein ACYTFK_08855 [Planctomycetota bacterium]|jgi:hypothetical protein